MEYELLLINISRDLSGYSESFRDSIGQYLIASYLRKYSFKAYVFSGNVAECKKVIQHEILKNKVPIIGFYAAADNIRVVKHAITWIKSKFPNVKTIIGGPQAIDLDYIFFKETGNDFAIIGEGEIPMYLLLSALVDDSYDLRKVPSLVMRDSEKELLIVNQCNDAVITDLDSIPYPSMVDSIAKNLRQGKMAGIITGRGCPYQCTFCYEGNNAKNVRFRSILNVMEEIDYVCENNKRLEYINIYDDTFTLKKERVFEFCKEIKKRNIRWFCEGHVTFVLKNQDILNKMVASGLTCIQFGIESGSNVVLDAYNKHTNFDMIVETIKICKKSGIHGITGNFIIGGAFETRETIEESKRLAKELINSAKGIIELYTVYFAPYPNTRIVNTPEKFDIKLHKELEKCNLNTMRSPVVETESLSTNDIYELKRDFESYIEQLYREAAISSNKEDILQGLFHDGIRMHLNPTWERHYLSHSYIVTFLEHLTEKEQLFNPEFYIIRTFEDFVFDEDGILSEVGRFSGLEMKVLVNATGIYNSTEMAEVFGVSIDDIKDVYDKLNNKCMVYMSEF
ncbi:B12-binding domain-containing radical SAM protein [Clostridium novyi]|uniref:B12-binding domain-containing radical SAM protein n=1 Tax=Clostridium novyi TaxID=1542 RepID=UPI000690BBA3|nr:radical SAM protein [Clostridium novyi]